MRVEIKNRWTGEVLFGCDVPEGTQLPLKYAVEAAVKGGADLVRADLGGAYLGGADLRGAYLGLANLRRADLGGADLRGADLRGADLGGADLRRADLRGADLGGADLGLANLRRADLGWADLRRADLRGADLGGADLVRADLRGADLGGADLGGADLVGADLGGANLVGADLGGANLVGADLGGANLGRANLYEIADDLYEVLSFAPDEAPALLAAVRAGKINGQVYYGECACLVGTIANARKCTYSQIDGLTPNSDRPAERWFLALKPGDTPKNSQVAAITERWIEDWLKYNAPKKEWVKS